MNVVPSSAETVETKNIEAAGAPSSESSASFDAAAGNAPEAEKPKTTAKKSTAKKSTAKTTAKRSSSGKTSKKTTARKKKLVIVESPSKAKTIGKFLGSTYRVVASVGHVRDLPKSKLGIDIDHDFEPQYISIRGKGDLIKELKREAKKDRAYYPDKSLP